MKHERKALIVDIILGFILFGHIINSHLTTRHLEWSGVIPLFVASITAVLGLTSFRDLDYIVTIKEFFRFNCNFWLEKLALIYALILHVMLFIDLPVAFNIFSVGFMGYFGLVYYKKY